MNNEFNCTVYMALNCVIFYIMLLYIESIAI